MGEAKANNIVADRWSLRPLLGMQDRQERFERVLMTSKELESIALVCGI
jgi:hypothetical protein